MERIAEGRAVCANCGQGSDCKRCSKCKKVCYCGEACQKHHWQQHKLVCGSVTQERQAKTAVDIYQEIQRNATRLGSPPADGEPLSPEAIQAFMSILDVSPKAAAVKLGTVAGKKVKKARKECNAQMITMLKSWTPAQRQEFLKTDNEMWGRDDKSRYFEHLIQDLDRQS